MKGLVNSFIMAFSGYAIGGKSKLERNKENCSFILIFIPLIGLICTVLINRWAVLYPYVCENPVLPAIFTVVVPIIVTGGSNLKGFFKTADALSSHKSKEEKLAILFDDAHSGYSSIIACIAYFLIAIGIWSEMPIDGIFVVAFAYIISRSLFSISLLTMKIVPGNRAENFVPDNKMAKLIQIAVNLGYIIICAVLMYDIALSFEMVNVAIICLVGAAISYLYYIYIAKSHFGGVSEELASFFVTICEVVMPFATLFAFKNPF